MQHLPSPKNLSTPIALAISGGVDSSVAAHILQRQGYQVHGFFLDNWQEPDQSICQHIQQDAQMAQAVCEQIGIPLTILNFSKAYWQKVFSSFLDDHLLGKTPNPDILCNQEIKFKALLEHILSNGYQYLATGHHARITFCEQYGYYQLRKGHDLQKDQSYFLCQLNQYQLKHSIFPIGHMTKPQVREYAKSAKLPTASKKDSTGLCFIGERPFKDFLSQYLLGKPGDIIDDNNTVIGRHDGLMFYTIGQRKGLAIGGRSGATEEPWYVIDKDLANNCLMVAQGYHHPKLYASALYLEAIHWIESPPSSMPLDCYAKIRYRQSDQPCQLDYQHEQYTLSFATPQRAITPGQYAVLYQDDRCIGSGSIKQAQACINTLKAPP